VAARTEEAKWQKRQSPGRRRLLMYAMLAMLPVAILLLLYLVARHR
jgi:hypothetical protein